MEGGNYTIGGVDSRRRLPLHQPQRLIDQSSVPRPDQSAIGIPDAADFDHFGMHVNRVADERRAIGVEIGVRERETGPQESADSRTGAGPKRPGISNLDNASTK